MLYQIVNNNITYFLKNRYICNRKYICYSIQIIQFNVISKNWLKNLTNIFQIMKLIAENWGFEIPIITRIIPIYHHPTMTLIDKEFKFEFTFQEKKLGTILDSYSEGISGPVHHRHTTFIVFCFHIFVRKGILHNGQY